MRENCNNGGDREKYWDDERSGKENQICTVKQNQNPAITKGDRAKKPRGRGKNYNNNGDRVKC